MTASTLALIVFPVTAFEQNCSLIWDTTTLKAAVVDPGGNPDGILQLAKAHAVTIEKILITHAQRPP